MKNAKGSEVGLSMVKAIVEVNKGIVKVESKVNIGSKYTIVLPK